MWAKGVLLPWHPLVLSLRVEWTLLGSVHSPAGKEALVFAVCLRFFLSCSTPPFAVEGSGSPGGVGSSAQEGACFNLSANVL